MIKAIAGESHTGSRRIFFAFKERRIVALSNCCRDAEGERKDKRDGMFFDRNRLIPIPVADIIVDHPGKFLGNTLALERDDLLAVHIDGRGRTLAGTG